VHLAALHASYAAFSDVVSFLDAARDAGLALAVVTNGSTIAQRAKIDLLSRERFASIVVSAEHGVAKPDAAIFRIALDELGVDPVDAVHVGDHPVNDIEGSRRAGIRAILLDRAGAAPLGPDVAHDLDGVQALLGL
jgi:putative hydrolase of the HAD superfamily